MLADYAGFEQKRKDNLERILKLLRTEGTSPERKLLLRKLKAKWKSCKAHCRYVVTTNLSYDFGSTNDAHDIRWRSMKIGSIVVEKVFADGGVMFSRADCAKVKAWIQLNFMNM
jgi:hypothetical protein